MNVLHFAAWKIDSLMDLVGPAFVALFFFILPILRALKEAKEKQREAEARRTQAPAEEKSDEQKAKEMWADLLRGEAPAPPPRPPPVPSPARPVPQPIASNAGPPPQLAPPMQVFSDVPTEAEMESTFDATREAQVQNEAALRNERTRRDDFLRREREGAETPRASVEPTAMTSFELGGDEVIEIQARALRRRDLLGLEKNRRAALRRALVGAEVLGRPVALRTGGEEIGPLALRR
jgi:hypothetical protein